MLKKLAMFLLALLVIPVQTYSQPHKAEQGGHTNQPSGSASTVSPQQRDGQSLQAENEKHVNADVRVISSPERDPYDKVAVWANISLVLVGIAGIVLACLTLKQIARQVATFCGRERARLVVEIGPFELRLPSIPCEVNLRVTKPRSQQGIRGAISMCIESGIGPLEG